MIKWIRVLSLPQYSDNRFVGEINEQPILYPRLEKNTIFFRTEKTMNLNPN